MSDKKFTATFHFPYASVKTDAMEENETRWLVERIITKNQESFKIGDRTIYPNIELMTYVEIEPVRGF